MRDGNPDRVVQPLALAEEPARAIEDSSERALALSEIARLQLDAVFGRGRDAG